MASKPHSGIFRRECGSSSRSTATASIRASCLAARTPGGLTYTQVMDLIAGVGRRARIAGFDLVELYPPADIDGLSALTAARLLVNVIGTIVRQV